MMVKERGVVVAPINYFSSSITSQLFILYYYVIYICIKVPEYIFTCHVCWGGGGRSFRCYLKYCPQVMMVKERGVVGGTNKLLLFFNNFQCFMLYYYVIYISIKDPEYIFTCHVCWGEGGGVGGSVVISSRRAGDDGQGGRGCGGTNKLKEVIQRSTLITTFSHHSLFWGLVILLYLTGQHR